MDQKQRKDFSGVMDSTLLHSGNFKFDKSNTNSNTNDITAKKKFFLEGNRANLKSLLKPDDFGIKIKRNKSSIELATPARKLKKVNPLEDSDHMSDSYGSEDIISSGEDNPVNNFMKCYV